MIRFAAAAVLLLTFSTATLADLIIEARETGGDVVFTASGSLDLTGWGVSQVPTTLNAGINPSFGIISFGSPQVFFYQFGSLIPPSSIGPGDGFTSASSTSGDPFGFGAFNPVFGSYVYVEAGYVFGDPIEATMTFEDATLDSLQIVPDEYVWSWSTEPASLDVSPISLAMESITFRAIAIPEPSAFACIGLIGLVAGGRSWWKRRR